MQPLQGFLNAVIFSFGNSYIKNVISKFFCKKDGLSKSEILEDRSRTGLIKREDENNILFQDGSRIFISTKSKD